MELFAAHNSKKKNKKNGKVGLFESFLALHKREGQIRTMCPLGHRKTTNSASTKRLSVGIWRFHHFKIYNSMVFTNAAARLKMFA